MKTLVSYTVPTLSGHGFARRFYMRAEGSPNTRAHATRFDSTEAAGEAADIVRENLRGTLPAGQYARVRFHLITLGGA